MTKVFLVKFDLEFASAAPAGDSEPVNLFINQQSASLSRVRFEVQPNSSTGRIMQIGDFLSFNVNSHYGLASPRARVWLNDAQYIRFAPIALSKDLRNFEAFSVDRVLEDNVVDFEKSDIYVDQFRIWRDVRRVTFMRDLGAESLFRLKEQDHYLLCTQRAVQSYESLSLTGLKFSEVSPVHRATQRWYSAE